MPSIEKASVNDQSGVQLLMDGEADKEAAQIAKKKAEDRHMAFWISKLKSWIEENKEKGRGDDSRTIDDAAKLPESILSNATVKLGGDVQAALVPVEKIAGPAAVEGEAKIDAERAEGVRPETPGDSKMSIGAAFLNIESEANSEEERDKAEEVLALPINVPTEAQIQEVVKEKLSPVVMSKAISGESSATENDSEDIAIPPLPRQALPMQIRNGRGMGRSLDMGSSLALQQATLQDERPTEATSPMTSPQHGNSLPMTSSSTSLMGLGTATSLRRGLRNKKSLPDLRQSHSAIMTERRENTDASMALAEENPSSSQRQRRPSGNNPRRPPLPLSNSESGTSLASRPDLSKSTIGDIPDEGKRRPSNATEQYSDAGASSSGGNKSAYSTNLVDVQNASTSGAVEVERNSYFRRLSTLPASTISKSISIPVLQCVDATRGILYALSQMHTALKQYITFATDERMTSQLSRALDIASSSMAGFINSLDRFDSLSRIKGGTLNPIVVRGVLVSCSESVVSFRKVVSVFQLQLKSLQGGADIRYTRTLLLLLYGSLAEVGNSWKLMEPLFTDVIPYLQGQDVNSTPTLATAGASNPYTLPSIAEASSPVSPSNARFNATGPSRPMRRRHAGSFSAHDVAQGAYMIPSAPLPTQVHEESRKGQRPAALGPIPPSTRSAQYQIQQGGIEGDHFLEANQTITSTSTTEPPLLKEHTRRTTDEVGTSMSRRTLSNTSGGNASTMSKFQSTTPLGTPFASGFSVVETGKTMVDDHLVLLLVRITSIAYVVWASINDHLTTLGISIDGKEAPSDVYVTPDSTPLLDGDSFAASPHTPAGNPRGMEGSSSSSTATIIQDQSEEFMSPVSSLSKGNGRQPQEQRSLNANVVNKLRQLRELTNKLVEQTHRLEVCCEKVQERSGPRSPPSNAIIASSNEAFRELYSESSTFIKSILHISHYLKSLSLEHQLPKSIKSNLGQLTTCARDLTLHLHFLGGPPSSSSAASNQALSPVQQSRQGDE